MAKGAFWLEDSPTEVVSGDLRITSGVVSLTGGGSLIGEWAEAAVELNMASGVLRLTAEGETIVFRPASPAAAAELGIESEVRGRIQAAAESAGSGGALPNQSHDPTRRMSDRTAGIVAGVIAVLAIAAGTAYALSGGQDSDSSGVRVAVGERDGTTIVVESVPPSSTLAILPSTSAPSTTTSVTSPTTTVSSTTTSTKAVTTTTVPAVTTTTAPPPPSGASEIFGNGTYLVNRDILAGLWEAWPTNSSCLWARLSGTEFLTQNIIEFGGAGGTSGNVMSSVRVQVASTDVAFHIQNCGRWERIG